MTVNEAVPARMALFIADAKDILRDGRRAILRAATAYLDNDSNLGLLNMRQKLHEDLMWVMVHKARGHHTRDEEQHAKDALYHVIDQYIATVCKEFPELCYTNPYWVQSKKSAGDNLGYAFNDVAIRKFLQITEEAPF